MTNERQLSNELGHASRFFIYINSVHMQMVNLYRDPTGERVFESANPSKLAQPKTTKEHRSMAMGLSDLTDGEKVELLDSRVKVLEERVEEKNQRINQLETFMNT